VQTLLAPARLRSEFGCCTAVPYNMVSDAVVKRSHAALYQKMTHNGNAMASFGS